MFKIIDKLESWLAGLQAVWQAVWQVGRLAGLFADWLWLVGWQAGLVIHLTFNLATIPPTQSPKASISHNVLKELYK